MFLRHYVQVNYSQHINSLSASKFGNGGTKSKLLVNTRLLIPVILYLLLKIKFSIQLNNNLWNYNYIGHVVDLSK